MKQLFLALASAALLTTGCHTDGPTSEGHNMNGSGVGTYNNDMNGMDTSGHAPGTPGGIDNSGAASSPGGATDNSTTTVNPQ